MPSGPLRSPFPPRTRSRAVLPPIGLQSVFREVRTEDELRQALQPPKAPTGLDGFLALTGRRIVIAAPITLTRPIVISPSLPGTVIEAHGHLPIFPGVDGIDAFDIRAPLVTIRNLLIYNDVAKGRYFGRAFALTRDAGTDGPTDCRIRDCVVVGGNQMLDDTTNGNATSGILSGCSFAPFIGAVDADCVIIDSINWFVEGNTLQKVGAGVSLRLGTNALATRIVANNMTSGGIDTASSLGGNTISANVASGTVTAHATDDTLGGNT